MRELCGKEIALAQAGLVLDCEGSLYWPEQRLLVISDLHFEKGSSFAARGVLLPPHDTATALTRLGRLIGRYAPCAVIALGDSFHDGKGPRRMRESNGRALAGLQR